MTQSKLGFFLKRLGIFSDKFCIHFVSPVAAEQGSYQPLFATLVSFTAPAVVNGNFD